MPQTKSRKKDLRKALARRERNRAVKKVVRMAVRAAKESGEAQGPEVSTAYKQLDKAARRGVIHPRTAARRKSRLMRQLQPGSSPE